MQTLSYIDNNLQLGIAYDWDLIIKAYRALKCPDDVYDPIPALRTLSAETVKWYFDWCNNVLALRNANILYKTAR